MVQREGTRIVQSVQCLEGWDVNGWSCTLVLFQGEWQYHHNQQADTPHHTLRQSVDLCIHLYSLLLREPWPRWRQLPRSDEISWI
jgi:hypothetical protein